MSSPKVDLLKRSFLIAVSKRNVFHVLVIETGPHPVTFFLEAIHRCRLFDSNKKNKCFPFAAFSCAYLVVYDLIYFLISLCPLPIVHHVQIFLCYKQDKTRCYSLCVKMSFAGGFPECPTRYQYPMQTGVVQYSLSQRVAHA